jgi:hypothetical protein
MGTPEAPKENPDSWSDEIGVEGIEALPRRVERYGQSKKRALDVAEYIGTQIYSEQPHHRKQFRKLVQRVLTCGDYLVFHHYFTVDKVRLHGASLCMKHLLCPLCAIRRGAKALKAYLDRWEVIKAAKPALRPFLVTLTVKNGDDLAERFRHLHAAQRELWKQRQRGRGSPLDGVEGAVWSYEVKRGRKSGKWHPHLHMIALAETMVIESEDNLGELSRTWHDITGDSHMVDVRPISQDDPVSGFLEVFKYAVKFSDQDPEDTFHCYQTLQGKRLIGSAGCFRGVDVPEDLTDDETDLADLPFVTLFYRYLGEGYTLDRQEAA